MKKAFSLIICLIILVSVSACSSNSTSGSSKSASTTVAATEQATAQISSANDKIKSELDNLKDAGYSGIVYAEMDGKPIASYAYGTLYGDKAITLDTPMPVGSVSKQFCAAAIMLLQEQDKLSTDDTLDKYFPDYKEGKKITLHDMLSQRSGIVNLDENTELDGITYENTDEQNTKVLLELLFDKPLNFEPGDEFEYSNFNYTLLSNIVEQVSGKPYIDFLRENFFEPLGMNHTGSVDELKNFPDWAEDFSYQQSDFVPIGIQPGLCKGAGDIISTASDMTVWMNALPSGKVISGESYQAMTTDYTKTSTHYGYGLFTDFSDGVGHFGSIGHFTACDYINTDTHVTLFMASNSASESTLPNYLFSLTPTLTFGANKSGEDN